MFFKIILSSSLLLISFVDFSKADCSVEIKNKMTNARNHDNWPLVLHPIVPQFYTLGPYPGQISVAREADLRLACPGRNNEFALFPPTQIITVKCIENQNFMYQNEVCNFYENFACKLTPKSSERSISPESNQLERFEIGFQITPIEFVPLITSDYNHQTKNVMTTSHTIYRFTDHRQKTERPSFLRGLHPVLAIDGLYDQETVNEVMDERIGVENRNRYFTDSSFLARGHMAAKTDFPFAAQQRATFYHLNCFPQFQGLNRLNWLELEKSIRDYDFLSDAQTFTNVEDILYLPNTANRLTALYLIDNVEFPVPLTVRKNIVTNDCIYSFIGFNHPNIQSPEFNSLRDNHRDACGDNAYAWLRDSLRNIDVRRNPLRGLFLCLTATGVNPIDPCRFDIETNTQIDDPEYLRK